MKSGQLITPNDLERSCTVHMIEQVFTLLRGIQGLVVNGKLLDIGCGFGGITSILKNFLSLQEAHGIDIDPIALAEASGKGVITKKVDISQGRLPYADNTFDIVTCFGVLDYLPYFDDILSEIFRVLKPGGWICVSLPNLASWHNRLALLLGYQPRDIEVSKRFLPGSHPYYRKRGERPVGHIHTITTRGFVELMEHYGFKTVRIAAMNPHKHRKLPFLVRLIDKTIGRSPCLARRFAYLGRR